jgi:hypothetical protein
MTILTQKQIADWRAANWFADNDDCADGFRALCGTAELGLRATEVLRRLDEIEDGSPITDRIGDGGAYAS